MFMVFKIISNHKIAVFLGVLCSIIVAFPQIYFRASMDDKNEQFFYGGIELLPDSPWSPRVREIQDGHNLGNIYYKDNKDDPYIFQPLGSAVVAYTGKIFSLNINNTLLLSRLIFTFIAFFLVYSFVFLFSKNKLISSSISSMIILAGSSMTLHGLKNILNGISPDHFLQISLPVNPAMIYIFFFSFLIAFYKFYEKPSFWLGLLSSFLLSLNFYNYFYSWTYLYAFGSILTIILFLKKCWPEAKRVSFVFLGALAFATPYLFNLFLASGFPTFADVAIRKGIIESNDLLFIGFVPIIAIVFYLFFYSKDDKSRYFIGLALLITPFLTMNQQILTGKVMQAAHYHWYFHKPIAIIFIFLVFFELLSRRSYFFVAKILGTVLILGSLFVGSFVQVYSYFYDEEEGGKSLFERQSYGVVMDWLNENANKEEVVLGNEMISSLVVIYTPLNVFHHRAGLYSLSVTNERLVETIFTFYRLKGINGKDAEKTFFDDKVYLAWNTHGIYYRELTGSQENFPDEKIRSLIDGYIKTLNTKSSVWLKDIFNKYEVQYIVWDKVSDPKWELQKYSFLNKVVTLGDFEIYQVNKK